MPLEVTVLNGGGTAAATVDLTSRLRADEGLQLGNRAFNGESSQSTLVLDDDEGEYGNSHDLPVGLTALSIAAHNVVTVKETATTPDTVLVRGRVIPKEIGRGQLWQDRGRTVTLRLDDYNADLKGLDLLAAQARPEETDVARATWVFNTFLSGSPRLTTDLTSGISSASPVTMPAKTYDKGTTLLDILGDCAITGEKTFFVMADGTFYYAPFSDMSKQAGLRISDRDDEIDFEGGGGVASVLASGHYEEDAGAEAIVGISVPDGTGALYFVWLTHDGLSNPAAVYRWDTGQDPVAMTLIASIEHDTPSTGENTDNETLHVFRLLNPLPSGGTAGITVTWTTGGDASNGAAFGYWAVDSTAEPTVVTAQGTGTSSSIDPGASSGDMVLDCVGWRIWSLGDASEEPAVGSSQTEDWAIGFNNSAGQPDMAWGGASKQGTGTRTWTWTTSTPWVAAAIVVPGEVATYPPIWTGPASTEDGQGLLSGGILRYGGSEAVTETRAEVVDDYDYWVETINDAQAVDATDAANRLSAILDIRQFEKRTYQVAVQLHRTKVNLLMAGQMISIKARAIPDADDQFRTRRIASLEWQWVGPEHWLAVMELDRPLDMRGAGGGSGSGQAALATRPSSAGQMPYDNSESGLDADTVQEAIDELAGTPLPGATSAGFSGALVHRVGTQQNISDQTNTAVIFGTEEYDTDDYWSSGNPTRFTIPADGKYEFWAETRMEGEASFNTGNTNFRFARFRIDGGPDQASQYFGGHHAKAVDAASQNLEASGVAVLDAGQYVEFVVYQNSGETLQVPSDSGTYSRFAIRRIQDGVTVEDIQNAGRWEPVVHDSGSGPEIVFLDGDIVMHWVTD